MCRYCRRHAAVIIGGAHLCSTHALDVTLGHDPLVVDLRSTEGPVIEVEDVTVLARRLAS